MQKSAFETHFFLKVTKSGKMGRGGLCGLVDGEKKAGGQWPPAQTFAEVIQRFPRVALIRLALAGDARATFPQGKA